MSAKEKENFPIWNVLLPDLGIRVNKNQPIAGNANPEVQNSYNVILGFLEH